MLLSLLDQHTNGTVQAEISPAFSADMPLKKDGWEFNWRFLSKQTSSNFFSLSLKNELTKIQGMLMLSIEEGMLYMNNLEIAPHNRGEAGTFKDAAGILLAFAWQKTWELASENYRGFLVFESKTALVTLYQKKYGATLAMHNRMYIDPIAGTALTKKYLK